MRKHDLDKWLEEFDETEVGADTAAPAALSVAPPQAPRPDAELSPLWTPDEATEPTSDLAGRLLSRTVITPNQLEQARNLLKQSPGKRLADVLIDMGVDETEVQQEIAFDRGIPFERIDPQEIEERYFHRLGADYCKANGVMPLRDSGSRVVLGVTDPRRVFMLDEVRRKLHKPVKLVLVTQSDVMAVMENFTDEQVTDVAIDDIIKDIEEDDVEVVETHDTDMDLDLAKEAGESPVIRFVNYLIYDAVKNGASDIHIEPQEKKLRIRYRIDGILFEMMNPPHTMHAAIVSRLKIMANLDISERRLPQDGRVRALVNGRKLDLRLSTLPTGAGEKAVMRILDSRAAQVGLDELGMPENTLDLWKKQIAQPHGIILVTGPTGSGKTTTLYGSLAQMDRSKLNISTVEDPIEYQLSGLTQVQTHESIGMTFAAALRSLLRQDPDVVMVGEIRDEETARIAIQAAMTGHLVLSTLHTNDAPASITRLINIGVEPYLIGAAINAVLAQRLVRRICEHCREQIELDETTAEHLAMHGVDPRSVMAGAGCERCHQTGYSGRVGLYELLVLDDSIRDAIAGNPTVTELRRQCIDRGMVTLRMDGFSKVGEGRTTVDEVLRVTQGTI